MRCSVSDPFVNQLLREGGDWIFVLNKNQTTLFQSVEGYCNNKEATETKEILNSGHGRKGTKTIRFTTDVDWINNDFNFTGLSCTPWSSRKEGKGRCKDVDSIPHWVSKELG